MHATSTFIREEPVEFGDMNGPLIYWGPVERPVVAATVVCVCGAGTGRGVTATTAKAAA